MEPTLIPVLDNIASALNGIFWVLLISAITKGIWTIISNIHVK